MRTIRFVLAVLVIVGVASSPARLSAAESESERLETRVAELERRVAELEKQLQALRGGKIAQADPGREPEQRAGRASGEVKDKVTGVKFPSVDVRPDYICGYIYDSGGKPIDPKLGKAVAQAIGRAFRSGERSEYRAEADEKGYYEMRVTEGSYSMQAQLRMILNDDRLVLDLRPVQTTASRYDSTKGARQDFVWSISGTKPGMAGNPSKAWEYYGMYLKVSRKSFFRIKNPPKGTRFELTLTPEDALLDGSKGKSLTIEKRFENSVDDIIFSDVPVGAYVLTGVVIYPDRTEQRLWFQRPADPGDLWHTNLEVPVKVFDNSVSLQHISLTEVQLDKEKPE